MYCCDHGIPVTALATHAMALGVRFLAFHNEKSAGYAATAYGYLVGHPGVFLTVSGPRVRARAHRAGQRAGQRLAGGDDLGILRSERP